MQAKTEAKQVLGFIFQPGGGFWLAKKTRPKWQKGCFNGIGGVVREDETPDAAMRRFGLTEAGIDQEWVEYAEICRQGWRCLVYYTVLPFGHAPAGGKEDLRGIYEFSDLDILAVTVPLVAAVKMLVLGALEHQADPANFPWLSFHMRDGIPPHQQDEFEE